MRESAATRVARGATLLDATVPGWARRIEVPGLGMGFCASCILGQLFGDFTSGVIALKLKAGDEEGFGFDVYEDEIGDAVKSYEALADAWIDEIRRRLAPAPAPPARRRELAHA